MSRVRILNLPKDVNEEKLKQHIVKSLPPKAPSIDITDCSVRRNAAGVVRMGFLGLRTAAMGSYIVKAFNGTYMGHSKLQVELAKGLEQHNNNSSAELLEKGKKQQREGDAEEGGEKSKKRNKSESESNKKVVGDDDLLVQQRNEFVAERTKGGPSWSGEVLAPPSPAAIEAKEEMMTEEEIEAATLQKQQQLEAISDMDFLATKQKTPSGNKNDQQKEEKEEEDKNEEEEEDPATKLARRTKRVHVGGIPYAATEDDVKNFLSSKVGPVEAVHIPLTKDTKQSKGGAFVLFVKPEDAVKAMGEANGAIFMGRLIRVSAAEQDPHAAKRAVSGQGAAAEKLSSFKQQQQQEEKKGTVWNAAYMNSHTAVQHVANRLQVEANELVSVDAAGAAVRAAVAEAFLTTEAKNILGDEGIDFELLQSSANSLHRNRSNTTIVVKNLSPSVNFGELTKMFTHFGAVETVAVPTAATFIVLSFVHAQDARIAFQKLAYRKVGGLPLFLEWAPVGCLKDDEEEKEGTGKGSGAPAIDNASKRNEERLATAYITNLPFGISEENLRLFLGDVAPRCVRDLQFIQRVVLHSDKGRAFVTLRDDAALRYVISKANGRTFENRTVSVAESSAAEPRKTQRSKTSGVPPGANPVKLIVKNLPFEATEADLRQLFEAFSEVKAVRVPKKKHNFSAHRENNHRGFGFVEFLTQEEAASALSALSSTHLYGRHLVIEYAKMDE